MREKLIICADDYGLNRAVSAGILQLLEKQKINATSCMTTFLHWGEHASWLAPYLCHVDVGLHFNLTEGPGRISLGKLLLASHLRLIRQKDIEQQFLQQLTDFEDALGCLPSHIDGHQHVHHFPVVRDAILNVYQQQRLDSAQIYFRSVANLRAVPKGCGFKAFVIKHSGAIKFERLLQAYGLPHNQVFSGVYDFKNSHRYSEYFSSFLDAVGAEEAIIMCHPSLPNDSDDLARVRSAEFSYLID